MLAMINAISLESLQILLTRNLAELHRLRLVDIARAFGVLYAILKVAKVVRRRLKTTSLRGPPNPSFLWGLDKVLLTSPDSGIVYEKWAEDYGMVYEVPSVMGGRKIVLCDPKAVAHFYGGAARTYIGPRFRKVAAENLFGKGILTAVGEDHRRQRKALTPAFSNAAIRNLTPVFYDSAYKVKGVWEALIESNGSGSTVIDVQNGMNHVSLDTIGIAGFSHDFGSLHGKPASVTEAFGAFDGNANEKTNMLILMLAQVFPLLMKLPTPLSVILTRLNDTIGEIVDGLLTKSRKENDAGTLGVGEENSILGILIKSENQSSQHNLTREEVMAQAKVLLLAGYATTSTSLTWALIELSKNPDIQAKLRAELLEFGADPTYDQLSNNLPYLDAVVHETLRMHPPVIDTLRVAVEDDVIPLSKPVCTRSGKHVEHIAIAKGTNLIVPIRSVNRSTVLWGSDAKEFEPERWITQDGIPDRAKEVQGHRHLLTFIDGPKTCLGKGFAIAEFKVVLSVLVKNFVFEFRDGPETVIEMVRGILMRPKVQGELGTAVPLRVKRFE